MKIQAEILDEQKLVTDEKIIIDEKNVADEKLITKESIITFPEGLIGFENQHSFAILDSPYPPFYILQSTEEERLAFVLINPYLVRKDYVLDVPEKDFLSIHFESENDILVFAIVTIPNDFPEKISCNLLGPIIINRKEKLGCQSISMESKWSTKHFILEEVSVTEEP